MLLSGTSVTSMEPVPGEDCRLHPAVDSRRKHVLHGDIYDNEKQAPGMLLQRNDSADVPKLRIFPISIIYSIYLAITILIRYHLNI